MKMRISRYDVKEKVLIVAEIGNNHEGNFELAQRLVREAAACGVDAVKFQTFRTEHVVGRLDEERFRRLQSFELGYTQFGELSELAHSLGLLFLSTPLDLASAEFLSSIVDCYKIASGDNNFYPLISRVAQTGKPLIISSGLSDVAQVARTVAFVRKEWEASNLVGELAILHCVTSYPVAPEEANLRAIQFLGERFDVPVGYSDHTVGIDAALLAVALGARIIEKHFTLDKNFSDFRDHRLSAEPAEMADLVRRIRMAALMLGAREKVIQPCEKAVVQTVRRSIVASADLPRGHRLTWSDLTWIRPGGGLAPGEEHLLVGKLLKHSVGFGELLRPSDVE